MTILIKCPLLINGNIIFMNENFFLNGQLYIHQNKSPVKKEIREKKSVLCFKPLLWHYHYLVTLTMELHVIILNYF